MLRTKRSVAILMLFSFVVGSGCNGSALQSSQLVPGSQNRSLGSGLTVAAEAATSGGLVHPLGYAPGYTVTDLGTLGRTFSSNDDVDNSGAAAGTSTLAGDAATNGFLWTGGSLI